MTKMKMSEGIISAKPPAKRTGRADSFRKERTCAGRVRLRTVRMVAANTSFHDSTKANIEAAERPGSDIGSTTFQNAVTRLQPRVRAASSSSSGTLMKMLLVTRIVCGSARAVCTIATAQRVSYNRQLIKVIASGMESMTMGKARVVRMSIL